MAIVTIIEKLMSVNTVVRKMMMIFKDKQLHKVSKQTPYCMVKIITHAIRAEKRVIRLV